MYGSCTSDWEDYHITGSSGPNGLAMNSSIADLTIVMNNQQLLNSIKVFGGKLLEQKMSEL